MQLITYYTIFGNIRYIFYCPQTQRRSSAFSNIHDLLLSPGLTSTYSIFNLEEGSKTILLDDIQSIATLPQTNPELFI